MNTKLLLASITICLFCLVGCHNDTADDPGWQSGKLVQMTMRTTGPKTRADYTDTGSEMLFSWRAGDSISVCVSGVAGNEKRKLTADGRGLSSDFTGAVLTWEGARNIYMFYPYSPNGYSVYGGGNSTTATTIFDLPNPQTYTVGGPITNSLMVGSSQAIGGSSSIDAVVNMKQVMSIVQLNIINAPSKVKRVKLKCSEAVFPTIATVNLSDATIANPNAMVNELTMKVTDPTTTINKAISFAMFPADLTTKTISIEVAFEDGEIKTIDKSGLSFARNTHYVMTFDAIDAVAYVQLGGLNWAIGNLVAKGANDASIGTPEDGGLYFQFGSLIGWSGGATGDGTDRPSATLVPPLSQAVTPIGYMGNPPMSSAWTGDPTIDDPTTGKGDPCRYYLGGTWRLPTKADYDALFASSGYPNIGPWKISGSFLAGSINSYAIHTSGLKFPIVGYRAAPNGNFGGTGTIGDYWSATASTAANGYFLTLQNPYINSSYSGTRTTGLVIRCVNQSVSGEDANRQDW